MAIKKHLLVGLFLAVVSFAVGQTEEERFEVLRERLELYAAEYPKVDKLIDISITGSLQEFAIAFSKETKLNLTIDPSINKQVVTNFAETRPRDILLHLCKFYSLSLSFSGSIISLIPYMQPTKQIDPKEVDVIYNSYNDLLEMNLKRDTLDQVVKRISQLSQKNVITTKSASQTIVSGYIGKANFENALELMAQRNDLNLTKDDKGFYLLSARISASTVAGGNNVTPQSNPNNKPRNTRTNTTRNNNSRKANADLNVKAFIDSLGQTRIDIQAFDASLSDIIKEASLKANQNFFLFTEPTEKISLDLKGITYDQFLDMTLQGSKYIYDFENGIYLIGEPNLEGLRTVEVIQFKHRSAKEFLRYVPKDLTSDLEILEFLGLNSLILSGAPESITELKEFVEDVDKSVPVVMIELLILDVQKNHEVRAGVEAGVAENVPTAGGSVFPGVDFTFSSNAINELLRTLSGNGIINLGQVNPNFYATLQAIEDNGYVNVRSKPRLSTLNGEEANLTIGETRYYLNERTTLQGNQNPVTLQDRRYEAVNADFSIRILPVVSGDEHVTLEIDVNQSDFIGQIQSNAPPPQVNRTFTSNIRILNGEMIVLGGLESKRIEDSGSGVPFLARIPVIKWLFSKRRRAKSNSKLLIFVKPTIIY